VESRYASTQTDRLDGRVGGVRAWPRAGTVYKYAVRSRDGAYLVDKADPYAIHAEVPPNTGSVVWGLDYAWSDAEWMTTRPGRHALTAPMSIYEVHLGSWMRRPEEGYRSLSYRRSRRGSPITANGWGSRTWSCCR